MKDDLPRGPHRRYNALTGEWILVSAGRDARPWLGAAEPAPVEARPAFDPGCYLCPGNERAGGARNPSYTGPFVFTNDFAALTPTDDPSSYEYGLLRAETEAGTCRVLCYTPRHDLDLGRLPHEEMREVVDVWADQTTELGRRYRWVQVFENRGTAMGASSPHPHGQIWAGAAIPSETAKEDAAQRRHHGLAGRRLLADYAEQESGGPRVVDEDPEWLAIVPFWAAWPYEALLIPRRPFARLPDLDDQARDGLAASLKRLLGRYDALFGIPFPYSLGWHGAPYGEGGATASWQLHGHAYPPLLRASTRKFMVGYELLAEPQRDLSPEDAASRLRAAGTDSDGLTGPRPQRAVD
jgi:UDPglucose--hexose-1-phosphate uridylyltransferase